MRGKELDEEVSTALLKSLFSRGGSPMEESEEGVVLRRI